MKIKALILATLLACAVGAAAQTNTAGTLDQLWSDVQASGLTSATNYSIDPYFTYAPNVTGSKFGGGLFLAYNLNQYVGTGLGVDYLGRFSMVSANIEFKLPTHPLGFLGLTNVAFVPVVITGVGDAIGGTGSGSGAVAIADVGAYVQFGHLWGGTFNLGGTYGTWSGAGQYSGAREHFFVGWSHGF